MKYPVFFLTASLSYRLKYIAKVSCSWAKVCILTTRPFTEYDEHSVEENDYSVKDKERESLTIPTV